MCVKKLGEDKADVLSGTLEGAADAPPARRKAANIDYKQLLGDVTMDRRPKNDAEDDFE